MYIKKSILSSVMVYFLLALLYGCGGSSSDETGLTNNVSHERQSNHIKALFFGTGPYSAPGNDPGCPGSRGRWVSFPVGSLLEVIIPTETTDDDYQFVVEEMDKINTAVAGYFTTMVVRSEKSDLTNPQENQITFNFVDRAGMKKYCGTEVGGGCIDMDFQKGGDYIIKNGTSFYPVDRGIFDVHEVGHGIGLCHVNQQVFPEGTMASAGGSTGVIPRFSDSELAAINFVFTSGMTVGSTEQEFWDAGLLP
ncbi:MULTISPECIES: hypothetical protein [unclassified Colwellia]|uniref:hypothetical protein n=1 Tax=unclassified Colwellia TaxID=196834 RepID=UPI0015F756BC|nr:MULTISPECIES: hypothetical protein [unclassified Colwellia]MBA6373180.1 hypothetical protein [Colwellia sp. BRX8-4]MBA6379133.1 hypothetical protein [Colwellia sp. BRX10-7]MBA6388843.1 hypothetical protein [Colwellia sp. BRX10-2]MBA6403647.1 hypothetical protein [Colwellia sp. BRX10-5]MBA6407389.1 hypothetical protein [Colwellia sp. BRX10-1]